MGTIDLCSLTGEFRFTRSIYTYLIQGENAIVYVPVLDVDETMWRIGYAVHGYFDLLGTFIFRL